MTPIERWYAIGCGNEWRLTSGDASAADARARYIARSRRAYLARVGGAAQKRFQAWTPRSGAAAASLCCCHPE
jgi:hypothetical protein